MSRILAWVLLGWGSVEVASAGHVFGRILENGQPVRGAGVILRCGGERPGGTTDNEGTYRLFAKTTGSCTLEVNVGGRVATGPLYSYDKPTAYDFDLVREGARWILRRR
ncbi:MAG: hypothetical protein JNK48_00285 [Bryobacterales bacterium]|nr:hypothetical protein [Bryobacterales bacterium]